MEEARNVALLALIYREQYLERRQGLDSIADDLESCPGEVSWLTMIAVDRLTPGDWALLRKLDEPSDFLRLARRVDPLRAEALLHAVPPNGRCSLKLWAAPYLARWGQVQELMLQLQQEGYTVKRDDLESRAVGAWMGATGDTPQQYVEKFA
jgi:hypothetical protein